MKMNLPLVCLALILSSATASTPVLDIDGDEVRAGVAYKIYYPLPPLLSTQPLGLGQTGQNSCPLDVVLKFCRTESCGIPLSFHPSEGRSVVGESEDVNIMFDYSTGCPDYSTVWRVVGDEKDEEYVSTGGVLGPQDLTTSWFSIKSAGLMLPRVYELVYCHRLQNYKHVAAGGRLGTCGTLGFNDERLIVQGLGGTPFRFIIVKDNINSKPTISSVV